MEVLYLAELLYFLNTSGVSTDHWGFIEAMENADEVCDGQHACTSWKKGNGDKY